MQAVSQLQGGGLNARAILSFAGVDLVLAPGDLRLIESAAELVAHSPPAHGVGWITAFDRPWPVYALSFDLRPLVTGTPADRRMCALLGQPSGLYGLLCDDIRVLREDTLSFHPLPAAMRPAGSPIRTLAVGAAGILCGTESALLADHIGIASVTDGPRVAAGASS